MELLQKQHQEEPQNQKQHLVVRGAPDHLGLANLKLLIVAVDDLGSWPGDPDEADTPSVGGQFHGTLGGHGVAGVEDGGARKRPEHGDVLQRHLAGAVLSYGDSTVAADLSRDK